MPQLKRPNYVVFDETGRLSELYCKICGDQIGARVRVLVGKRMEDGILNNDYVLEFQRFPNYVESRIEFEDGSAHVTLGCERCLVDTLTPDILDAIHQADLDYSSPESSQRYRSRKPKRLMGSKRGGGVR